MAFRKYLFYIFLFFYFPVNICAQTEESWGQVISEQFRTQLEIFPQEKVYMHIDRYFYQPNDTAWFALYLVDAATHQPLEADQIIYVELIDQLDSVACRIKIAPDQHFRYFGHLTLLEEYGIGKFIIRAYAPYMASSDEAYFFKREIIIGGTQQKLTNTEVPDYEIQFLPEGGQILEGTACYVAFKAIDKNGMGISVGGDIVDDEDHIQTTFESNNLGMGVFLLTAAPGKQYFARCRTDKHTEIKKYKLPDAYKQGYALQVKRANNRLLVSVKNAMNQTTNEPLYLLIHSRGIVQELIRWDPGKDFIAFQEKLFPAGILHILLLDQQKQIRSERLIFSMNETDFARVNLQTDKQAYQTREQIRSTIMLKDANNLPLQGRFSVSVTDDQNSYIDTLQTIASTLLLTSELKGYVESTGEYFRKDNRQAAINLDYLMMTQGWRRYDVSAILHQNYQEPVIDWDGGLMLSGIVRGGYNSSPIEGSNLTLYASTGDYFASTETDQHGRFSFSLPNTPDSTLFRVQLTPSLSYGNNSITFDTPSYPGFSRPYKGTPGTQIQTENTFAWNIKLPDVGITARKRELKPKPISDFTRYASQTFDQAYLESRPVLTWESVLANIPGTNILKNNNDIYVFLGRMGGLEGLEPARIMLDGMLLSNNAFLSDIEILDVAQIDIIKGTRASIFSSEGMGGIISVSTKTISGTKRQTNGNIVKMIYPLGCQQSVEFYSPSYTSWDNYSTAKDLRKTLFWKPDLNTNESGEAIFDFYSADVPTTYTILIEGISADGKLIYHISPLLINNKDK